MSAQTDIGWTDATWNPVTGCTKISEGCRNCYAAAMAKRFWGDREFTDVWLHPDRLKLPLNWKTPRRVFVNSVSDLFHEKVPNEFIDRVFEVMENCQRHTYQILTKRHTRLAEYMQWRWGEGRIPCRNIWLGVSVENQQAADKRIPCLLRCPAAVRFLSIEPMLSPIDFMNADGDRLRGGMGGIHWMIIGCESGQRRRPMHLDWARSLVEQCKSAGVPVFVKQLEVAGKVTTDLSQFPDDLRVREFPKEATR